MPRAEAGTLCLQVHIALDTMRRGRGNAHAAQTLCQVLILTGLLAKAGYGDATFEQMRNAESIVLAAFNRGRDLEVWSIDEEDFRQFVAIITTYDYQMKRAPLAAIVGASGRLEHFRAGESFEQVARKRA